MASGNSLYSWAALGAELPATGAAGLGLRNGHPTIDYDAAATEGAAFTGVLPRHYAGGGVTVTLYWMAASATTGNVLWDSAIERMNTDLDTDSYATAVTGAATACSGTSGITVATAITHTSGAAMDGLAAGETFRLRIQRLGGNGADTMASDAQLVAVELREV